MIRNLTVLGLAIAALLATSAVAVSTASAQTQGTFTSTSGVSSTLDIVEKNLGKGIGNKLTFFGKAVECPGTTYTGHKYNVTPKVRIPQKATTATITPHYSANCKAIFAGEHKATVTPNGCDFVFHLGNAIAGGTDEYEVTTDVVCPNDQTPIIMHSYFAAGNENIDVCTETIFTQSGIHGTPGKPVIARTNTTNDDIEVFGTFAGIHITQDPGTGLAGCASETTTEGELHLEATATGTDEVGLPEGVTVSD